MADWSRINEYAGRATRHTNQTLANEQGEEELERLRRQQEEALRLAQEHQTAENVSPQYETAKAVYMKQTDNGIAVPQVVEYNPQAPYQTVPLHIGPNGTTQDVTLSPADIESIRQNTADMRQRMTTPTGLREYGDARSRYLQAARDVSNQTAIEKPNGEILTDKPFEDVYQAMGTKYGQAHTDNGVLNGYENQNLVLQLANDDKRADFDAATAKVNEEKFSRDLQTMTSVGANENEIRDYRATYGDLDQVQTGDYYDALLKTKYGNKALTYLMNYAANDYGVQNEEIKRGTSHDLISNDISIYQRGAESARRAFQKETGASDEEFNDAAKMASFIYDRDRVARDQAYQTEYYKGHPVEAALRSAQTVPENMAAGVGALAQTIADAGSKDAPNVYGGGYRIANDVATTRSAISSGIEQKHGKAGSFAYNTAMSAADSVANMTLSAVGGMSPAGAEALSVGANLLGIGRKAGEVWSLSTMAATAYANDYQRELERGLPKDRAQLSAGIAGAVEYLTEKLSLDDIWDMAAKAGAPATTNLLVDYLTHAGIEGSEEAVGDIANEIADRIINGNQSEYNQNVEKYMAQGMSRAEAKHAASADFGAQLVEDTAAGAISGALIAAGPTAMRVHGENVSARALKSGDELANFARVNDTNDSHYVSKGARDLSQQATDLAQTLADKQRAGEKVSTREARRVVELAAGAQEAEAEARIEGGPAAAIELMKGVDDNPIQFGEETVPEKYSDNNDMTPDEMVKGYGEAKTAQELAEVRHRAERSSDEETRKGANGVAYTAAEKRIVDSGAATQNEVNFYQIQPTRQESFLAGANGRQIDNRMTAENQLAYNEGLQYRNDQIANLKSVSDEDFKDIGAIKSTGRNATIDVTGEDGTVKTVSVNDIYLDTPAKRALVRIASRMSTAEEANAFKDSVKAGDNIVSYGRAFDAAYTGGLSGMTFDAVKESMGARVNLAGADRLRTAFDIGVKELGIKQAEADGKVPSQTIVKQYGTGKVVDNRTDKSDTSIDTFVKPYARATGNDVYIGGDYSSKMNGMFQESLQRITLNTKNPDSVLQTFFHEGVGEYTLSYAPKEYAKVRQEIVDYAIKQIGLSKFTDQIKRYQKAYQNFSGNESGAESMYDAIGEWMNDAIAGIFSTRAGIHDWVAYMGKNDSTRSIPEKVANYFKELSLAFRNLLNRGNLSEQAQMLARMGRDEAKRIRDDIFAAMDEAGINRTQATLAKEGQAVNDKAYSLSTDATSEEKNADREMRDAGLDVEYTKDGEIALAQSRDGYVIPLVSDNVLYSLPTMPETQRKLANSLRKRGFSDEEIDAALELVEEQATFLKAMQDAYPQLKDSLNKTLVTDITGQRSVLHSIIKNGEYPVNIDFLTVCKKRQAYMQVLEKMLEDGTFNEVKLDGNAIAGINDILRRHDYETACLCCFVESRRQQIQKWSETFVDAWNRQVDIAAGGKPVSEFGFGRSERGKQELSVEDLVDIYNDMQAHRQDAKTPTMNLGKGSVEEKMARLLKAEPSLRKHLTVRDVLSTNGVANLKAVSPDINSLLLQWYGSNTPKMVQDFNPYNGEIIDLAAGWMSTELGESLPGMASSGRYIGKYWKWATQRINSSERSQEEIREDEYGMRKFTENDLDEVIGGEYDHNSKGNKLKWNTPGQIRKSLATVNKNKRTEYLEGKALRKYLYDIGGARLQSFSDFLIENSLDYFQMFSDLSARKLPLHAYSKEIVFLKMFGMTGMRGNMSLIPLVDESLTRVKNNKGVTTGFTTPDGKFISIEEAKKHAGMKLGKDGKWTSYAGWGDFAHHIFVGKASFIQSIGWKDAIALQLDPRYSPYIGTIAIGISDEHILKMLDDPLIRMIIPYHASGMNPEYAEAMNIDVYKDYTDYQNERVYEAYDLKGNPIYDLYGKGISKVTIADPFNYNEAAKRLGDGRAAARELVEWCNKEHDIVSGGNVVGHAKFMPRFNGAVYDSNSHTWTLPGETFKTGARKGTVNENIDFSKHNNYYKVLEDFDMYDSVTEASSPQGAVTNTYRDEKHMLTAEQLAEYADRLRATGEFNGYEYTDEKGNKVKVSAEEEIQKYLKQAQMTMHEIMQKEIKDRALYHEKQDAEFGATQKEVEDFLRDKFPSKYEDRKAEYDRDRAEKEEAKAKKASQALDIPEKASFSLDLGVERTKNLIAVHNLTEEQLLTDLRMGGFPSPSIAIIREGMGHKLYGPISVLFNRKTIDPQLSRENMVYIGDSWTPTVSNVGIEYNLDEAVLSRAEKKILSVIPNNIASALGVERGLTSLAMTNADDSISKSNGNIFNAFANNRDVQTGYLAKIGRLPELNTVENDYGYGGLSSAAIISLAEKYGEDGIRKLQNSVSDPNSSAFTEFVDAVRESDPKKQTSKFLAAKGINTRGERIAFGIQEHPDRAYTILHGMQDYLESNSRSKPDVNGFYGSVRGAMKSEINSDGYREYVSDLFSGLVLGSGVPNGRADVDSRGNRRRFSYTHDAVTLENIARAMNRKAAKGVGAFTADKFRIVAQRNFRNVEEMHANEHLLRMASDEEYKRINDNIIKKIDSLASNISGMLGHQYAIDAMADVISNRKTAPGIETYLRKNYPTMNIAEGTGEKILELVKESNNIPTGYFEAKPRRAVYNREIAKVIAPDNIGEELCRELSNLGIQYELYPAGDEDARKRIVNSDDDVKFSLNVDSEDRELSESQKEFFKDSKVTDSKGRLKVMYHGTESYGFTVFDQNRARSNGYYGNGFYFADSDSHSSVYGKTYKVYLNITNPIEPGRLTFTKTQLRKFVQELADNEDYGIENYGEDATVSSIVNDLWKKHDDFGILNDLNSTCVGNFTEAVKVFNRVNGTDYDGIIVPTETVAFYPNQIKSVSNENPTALDDIRYSIEMPETDLSDDDYFRYLSGFNEGYEHDDTVRDVLDEGAKLLQGVKLNKKRLREISGGLLSSYQSKYPAGDFYEKISQIFAYASEYGISTEDLATITREVAAPVIEEATEPGGGEDFNYVRNYIKGYGKLKLSENQAHEVRYAYGSVFNFITMMRSRYGIEFSTKSGFPLDRAWTEIVEGTNHMFDEDIADGEQPLAIVDVLESLGDPVNIYREYKDEAVDNLGMGIVQKYFEYAAGEAADAKAKAKFAEASRALKKKLADTRREYAARYQNALRQAKQDIINQNAQKNKAAASRVEVREALAQLKQAERAQAALDKQKEVARRRENAIKEAAKEREAALKEQIKGAKEDARVRSAIRDMEQAQKFQARLDAQRNKSLEEMAALRANNRHRMTQMRERQQANHEKQMIARYGGRLMDYIEKPTDQKHVPDAVAKPVMEFLSAIDFMTPNVQTVNGRFKVRLVDHVENGRPVFHTETFDTYEEASAAFNKALSDGLGSNTQRTWFDKMNGLRELYADSAQNKFQKNGVDMGTFVERLDPDLADSLTDMLDRNKGVLRIADMSAADLHTLNLVTQNVYHAVNNMNKEIASQNKLGNAGIEIMDHARKVKKSASKTDFWDYFILSNATPYTYFRALGKGGMKLYKALLKASETKSRDIRTAQTYMVGVMGGIKQATVRTWTGSAAEVHTFRVGGRTVQLTTGQIMGLYELLKRDQAVGHLQVGGMLPGVIKNGRKTITQEQQLFLGTEDIQNIIGTLTDEQKRVADDMQKYMATECSEQGNEASMDMYGYAKFNDEHYYPIATKNNTHNTQMSQVMNNATNTVRNFGFGKALVPEATNPLVVDDIFDVFYTHVANMATYHAYAGTLSDVLRVYNMQDIIENTDGTRTYGGVKDAIDLIYGKHGNTGAGNKYFTNLLKDIQGQEQIRNDARHLSALMGHYKAAAVAGNLRVVLQQPTAFVRAAVVLDPKYMAAGIAPNAAAAKMQKETSIVSWQKSQGNIDGYEMRGMKQQITGFQTPVEALQEKLMAPAGKADDITWAYLYRCVYAEQKAKTNLDVNSKEFEDAVNDRFDEVISRTQVIDGTLYRSQFMRNKDALAQIQSAFMAEPTKSYNLFLQAALDIKANGWTKGTSGMLARTAAVFATTQVVTAMVQALVDAIRHRKDDDDDFWKQYSDEYWDNLIDNMNPMNLLPIVRDVSDVFEATFRNQTKAILESWGLDMSWLPDAQTYTTDNSRMDMAAISVVGNLFQSMVNGSGSKTTYGTLMDVAKVVSQFSGVPIYNVTRDMVAIYNLIPQLPNVLTREPGAGEKYTRLYNYINAGATDKIGDEVNTLVENGVSITDIRSRISGKYKSQYYDALQNGETAKAQKIGDGAVDAYEATGMSHEEAEDTVSGWSEKTVGYGPLDDAIESGEGLDDAVQTVMDSKDAQKIEKHIASRYASTLRYYRQNNIDTEESRALTESVNNALKAIGSDLTAEKLAQSESDDEAKDMAGAYYDLMQAIPTGKYSTEIDKLLKSGVKPSAIQSAVTSEYKPQYLELKKSNPTEAQKMENRLIDIYLTISNKGGTLKSEKDKTKHFRDLIRGWK